MNDVRLEELQACPSTHETKGKTTKERKLSRSQETVQMVYLIHTGYRDKTLMIFRYSHDEAFRDVFLSHNGERRRNRRERGLLDRERLRCHYERYIMRQHRELLTKP
ncbi:hypothetical protein KIN20_026112 [Parelaphostrongylus tenuis]|uniref:Uncharacterized protein n=1 Tax=Parelaphostrongylus tenuis TaxID=148309 RepID=A0AAD5NDM2_PARTN|nr:hypothetical protein KIN20_026112 [Parelaphostrongylus tenuis]